MLKSKIIKIAYNDKFDNSYIEKELSKICKSIVRWAIIDLNDEVITLSVSGMFE